MIQDLFFVGCDGSTNKDGIEISINIANGVFVLTPSCVGVFYGLPPGYSGNYPATYYTYGSDWILFQGNISSVYSELWLQSDDNMLTGTITANPALNVNVYIGSYGGKGSFDLPAGSTGAPFKIPIANYGIQQEADRTGRLAQIISGSVKK